MVPLLITIQTRNAHNLASGNEHNERNNLKVVTPKETGDKLNICGEEGMQAGFIISVWMCEWLESNVLKISYVMNTSGASKI